MNKFYAIAQALREHEVLTLPGLIKVRVMCRCGLRSEYDNEAQAKGGVAEHQAEYVMVALEDLEAETIVDAEVIDGEPSDVEG